uniref:Uncharacterized protein n=1 Tax=Pelusios castaneus TaxID=367368 RepID=A0A8C8R876_9SAUR
MVHCIVGPRSYSLVFNRILCDTGQVISFLCASAVHLYNGHNNTALPHRGVVRISTFKNSSHVGWANVPHWFPFPETSVLSADSPHKDCHMDLPPS